MRTPSKQQPPVANWGHTGCIGYPHCHVVSFRLHRVIWMSVGCGDAVWRTMKGRWWWAGDEIGIAYEDLIGLGRLGVITSCLLFVLSMFTEPTIYSGVAMYASYIYWLWRNGSDDRGGAMEGWMLCNTITVLLCVHASCFSLVLLTRLWLPFTLPEPH